MVYLYGLDFWRADLLPALDFSYLLDAVHSARNFTKFCEYVLSEFTCSWFYSIADLLF